MNTTFRRLSDRDLNRWKWECPVTLGAVIFAAMFFLFAFSALFFGP